MCPSSSCTNNCVYALHTVPKYLRYCVSTAHSCFFFASSVISLLNSFTNCSDWWVCVWGDFYRMMFWHAVWEKKQKSPTFSSKNGRNQNNRQYWAWHESANCLWLSIKWQKNWLSIPWTYLMNFSSCHKSISERFEGFTKQQIMFKKSIRIGKKITALKWKNVEFNFDFSFKGLVLCLLETLGYKMNKIQIIITHPYL